MHFLLPTCCNDPPVVKLNWWPPHDEYKPRVTPSATVPAGRTHFPLFVCFKFPFSNLNSSLVTENQSNLQKANLVSSKRCGSPKVLPRVQNSLTERKTMHKYAKYIFSSLYFFFVRNGRYLGGFYQPRPSAWWRITSFSINFFFISYSACLIHLF